MFLASMTLAAATLSEPASSAMDGRTRITAQALDPKVTDVWDDLDVIAQSLCIILQCYEIRPTGTGSFDSDSTPPIIQARVSSYQQHGLKEGLTPAEVTSGLEIVSNANDWLAANPGVLSSQLEADFADALGSMEQDLLNYQP